MLKIYFAGSIRGGREHIGFYREIIEYLRQYGEVLTEHVGDNKLSEEGEKGLGDESIYKRDIQWLKSSDAVVAEVSNPSLGVGFEIAKAIELNKYVLCLFKTQVDKKLSAMIAGCPDITIKEYTEIDDVKNELGNFLTFVKSKIQ